MKTIKELLEKKGPRPIFSVVPEDTVFTAVTKMVEMNVGAVLVMIDGNICGILTERDYLRFIAKQERTARTTPVSELMTRKVIYVTPDCSLDETMAIMTEQRIRHIPVLEGAELTGIVSIGDVVKQISRDQKVQIKYLQEYIADAYPGPAPAADKGE
jgi:CBS domain-containing protein